MITLKHKYTCESKDLIKEYQRQYSICLKVAYKYTMKGYNQKQIKELLKKYKNIELLKSNSWFLASIFYQVKEIIASRKETIERLKKRYKKGKFKNYKKKCKLEKSIKNLENKLCCFNKLLQYNRSRNNLTKEQFNTFKLTPICSIGDGLKHANRFFRILDESTIIFQPNKQTKITLNLYGHKNHESIIKILKEWQENSVHPISYKLDQECIYITYDENYLEKQPYKPIENRVIAIDMNPNYIGYSIIDWKDTETGKFKIINKGIFSQKPLNDYEDTLNLPSTDKLRKYIVNKRNYETFQISKKLVKLAIHYHCNLFAIEDITIDSKDLGRGRKNNRLCNNKWNRTKFILNLEKRCILAGIKLRKVIPEYTSYLGNIIYRYLNLPDMVLASIEISRRCYEYYLQYEKKSKEIDKVIRFPRLNKFVKNSIEKAKEALSIPVGFENYLQLYWWIKKNLGNKYRVPLDESKVFRQKYYKYCYLTC